MFVNKVNIGGADTIVSQYAIDAVEIISSSDGGVASVILTRDEVRDFLRVCALMDFLTDDEE